MNTNNLSSFLSYPVRFTLSMKTVVRMEQFVILFSLAIPMVISYWMSSLGHWPLVNAYHLMLWVNTLCTLKHAMEEIHLGQPWHV